MRAHLRTITVPQKANRDGTDGSEKSMYLSGKSSIVVVPVVSGKSIVYTGYRYIVHDGAVGSDHYAKPDKTITIPAIRNQSFVGLCRTTYWNSHYTFIPQAPAYKDRMFTCSQL